MSTDNRSVRLKTLVDSITGATGWTFSLDDFDDRVRLQKYVFLAEAFGFEHGYEYNMYHYGPYSPALAEDYYSDTFAATATNESLLSVVDTDSFFELVSGRSRQWLEVAATIKSLNAKYGRSEAGGKSHVVERTSTLKDVSPDGADRIYTELESFGVV